MPFFLPLLLGAAAGALKHAIVDKPKYDKENQLAADTQRLSPWTGLKATAAERPSIFGNVLQGGMTGLQVGSGLSKMGVGDMGMGGAAKTAATAAAAPTYGPMTQDQASAAGAGGGGSWMKMMKSGINGFLGNKDDKEQG